MVRKLRLLVLLPLGVLLFLQVGLCFGAVGVGADYPYGAGDTGPSTAHKINIVHPSASAVTSALFFTFMPELDGGELGAFQMLLIKTGSPVGYLCANLYETTGTYGSTAVPTGASLERSIIGFDVSMGSVQTSASYVWFNFSSTVALSAGTVYALSVEEVNETTCDTSNCVGLYYDAVGSYGGNCGYYQSGGWTSLGASIDACFVVYQEGGDLVSYFGGNTYITQQVTNVTSVLNNTAVSVGTVTAGDVAAGAVTAGDVSAGDVSAAGGVSVNVGGVTAAFNNTAVSAGDVAAGNVTAGDVALELGDSTINVTATENVMPWIIVLWIIMSVVIIVMPWRVWLLRFSFGLFGIILAVTQLQTSSLPFYPWILVVWMFMNVIVIYSSFARND